jgi:hypothetical protein
MVSYCILSCISTIMGWFALVIEAETSDVPCPLRHSMSQGAGGLAGVGGGEIEIGLVATLKKYSKGCPLLATRSSHLLGSVKETQHS